MTMGGTGADAVDHAALAEAVNCIDAKITKLEEEIIEHVHPELDRIIDAIEGPRIAHLDGSDGPDRVTEEGMAHKVNDMRDKLGNGVKLRLLARDRVYVAVIGGGAVVLAAFFGGN